MLLFETFTTKLSNYLSIIHVGHPWICENGVAPDRSLDPAVLSRLKQFSAMNKLKKMALRVSSICFWHYVSITLQQIIVAFDLDDF